MVAAFSFGQSEKAPSLMAGQESAVCYAISSFDSNAMKSPNPHSGIYKAETARTLDLNGGSPACNQGGGAGIRSQPVIVLNDQGGRSWK